MRNQPTSSSAPNQNQDSIAWVILCFSLGGALALLCACVLCCCRCRVVNASDRLLARELALGYGGESSGLPSSPSFMRIPKPNAIPLIGNTTPVVGG
ncbi:MAG: hypothetical protein ACD_42C00489G0001 [uncultured bacterium]|nr:MAG: hypothetical protein ACD_42C00489G0001 [uncultured bacterium]OGT48149.1 MAG: hypothetical protein A3E53_03045 [Gammaproteobacteria bacterium RIFCSPHIGHO2_12_FULL_39_24]